MPKSTRSEREAKNKPNFFHIRIPNNLSERPSGIEKKELRGMQSDAIYGRNVGER